MVTFSPPSSGAPSGPFLRTTEIICGCGIAGSPSFAVGADWPACSDHRGARAQGRRSRAGVDGRSTPAKMQAPVRRRVRGSLSGRVRRCGHHEGLGGGTQQLNVSSPPGSRGCRDSVPTIVMLRAAPREVVPDRSRIITSRLSGQVVYSHPAQVGLVGVTVREGGDCRECRFPGGDSRCAGDGCRLLGGAAGP